jgi:hypothetical protein
MGAPSIYASDGITPANLDRARRVQGLQRTLGAVPRSLGCFLMAHLLRTNWNQKLSHHFADAQSAMFPFSRLIGRCREAYARTRAILNCFERCACPHDCQALSAYQGTTLAATAGCIRPGF